MIAHLRGEILKKTDKGIILDTGNVGYFVNLANSILANINETETIELFIHSNIREDAFDLYGFSAYEDLEFFKQLLNINGIGARIAMEILNVPQSKIKTAILNNDEDFICEIHGIGKKLAKRLILELKDKIEKNFIADREYKGLTKAQQQEALEALEKLGYQRKEIVKMICDLPEGICATEEIITYFLKNN